MLLYAAYSDFTLLLWQITVGTNHFGPFYLMHWLYFGLFYLKHRLLDKLKANGDARIVWVTSSAEVMNNIDFDDLE